MSDILTKITSALSGDLVFLVTLFVLIFILTMYLGRNKIVTFILSFYPATLLYNIFPYTEKLVLMKGDVGVLVNKLIIFLVFYVISCFVVSKYSNSYNESFSTFQKTLFSLAILILFILFSYTVINFDILHNFSGIVDGIFGGTDRVFWWTIAPLLILIFA